MSEYYDRKGQPIGMMEWSASLKQNRTVEFYESPQGNVSTVWLGLNHQWGDGPPLIFETMVFGGALDQECYRYSTEEEAKAGHAAMVQRVKDSGTAWLTGRDL